ncbi:hypothetical protein QYM36_002226 [Artemia franciscana]|uniref:Uncharacterized protein n=1 Tax=Artemia franciscana TaxID=6661 RepID=A0AA88LB23_ARTSF|nr:hypothetical protein QYM36_002226 [Artemia franciscana]
MPEYSGSNDEQKIHVYVFTAAQEVPCADEDFYGWVTVDHGLMGLMGKSSSGSWTLVEGTDNLAKKLKRGDDFKNA